MPDANHHSIFSDAIERLEAFILDLGTLIEARARLFCLGVRGQFASQLRFASQVRVCPNQRELFFGISIIDAIHHQGRQLRSIIELLGDRRHALGNPG